jgi:HEAT repeat protein
MHPSGTLGVVTTDRHLVVRGWNEWVAAATGLPEAGVVGRPLLELVTDERAEFYRDLFAEVLASGTSRVLAPAFHHYLIACAPSVPSEHFTHMQQRVTVAPLRAEADVVGVMITLEDVTERLERERALAALLAQPSPTPGAVDARAGLSSDDWRLRGQAVRVLKQSASVDEIRGLFESLQREHHDLNLLNSALRVVIASGRAVVAPLIELLSDEAPNLRMHAALALGELNAVPAVPALMAALDDADENVRFHAIEALGRIGAPQSIEALAAIAAGGEFFLGFAAVEALSKADDARVAPLMVQLLDQELLRPAVITTLGAIGDEDTVAPLARLLNEPGVDPGPIATALVRIHARYEESLGAGSFVIDAVRSTLNADAAEMLSAAVERGGADRVALATVLGWISLPAVDALAGLLAHADLETTVMRALSVIGKDAVPALLRQLDEGSARVRIAAATALGNLDDRRAVAPLVAALDDTDAEVVTAAAGALAGLGDDSAVDGLFAVFAHPHAAARRAAIAAVNTIGAQGTAARVKAALADPLPRVRECALRTAGYFGFPDCLPAIVQALSDDSEDVRRAAIEQLPMMDGFDASSRLLLAVANETPRNRAAAAHALRHADDPRVGAALAAALSDPDPWVRYYAATSLSEGRFGGVTAPRLAQLASQDAAVPVRIAAVTALARLDASLAASVAAVLIDDPEDDVAMAAVTVLAGIQGPAADERLDRAARSPRQSLQMAVIRALGERPQAEAVELLSWAARSGQANGGAGEAIESLRKIAASPANPTARRAAVAALLDLAVEGHRREEVIAALGRLPDDSAALVASGLSASRPDIRIATVESLAAMRQAAASSELTRALSDEEPSVRAAAVTAFARLGSSSVARIIASMRHTDPDEGVRFRAVQACSRHGWGNGPSPVK